MSGLNTIDDPQDIQDTNIADGQNISFDSGAIGPRPGSKIFIKRPDGETGRAFQLMNPKTSDGEQFLIAVYGVNFYVYDPVNDLLLPINKTYIPSTQEEILTVTGSLAGYLVGETITGSLSSKTATIKSIGINTITVGNPSGTFMVGDVFTGSTSHTNTATLVSSSITSINEFGWTN